MKIFFLLVLGILAFNGSLFGQAPAKKNSRPIENTIQEIKAPEKVGENQFTYEFSNPKFYISNITIEHDEFGKGKLSFHKSDSNETIKQPLEISERTLAKLKLLFEKLNYLNTTEVFQSGERDYSHLGTAKITLRSSGIQHTDSFNWTENLEARELAEEYRRIANRGIWMFDFNVARRNQPLETPKVLKRLEAQMRINSIADPKSLVPFLKEIASDESVPLIARNQADRIVKKIEGM